MDSLLAGAALALILRTRHHDLVLRWVRPAVILSGSAALGVLILQGLAVGNSAWPSWVSPFLLAIRYTILALFFTAFLVWCLKKKSVLQTFFSLPALRFFGKYSYGLYVLHLLFLEPLLQVLRHWIHLFTPNKFIALVGSGILAFMVSTVAAYLSFHLYEARFLSLKHYFAYDRPSHGDLSRTPSRKSGPVVSA